MLLEIASRIYGRKGYSSSNRRFSPVPTFNDKYILISLYWIPILLPALHASIGWACRNLAVPRVCLQGLLSLSKPLSCQQLKRSRSLLVTESGAFQSCVGPAHGRTLPVSEGGEAANSNATSLWHLQKRAGSESLQVLHIAWQSPGQLCMGSLRNHSQALLCHIQLNCCDYFFLGGVTKTRK